MEKPRGKAAGMALGIKLTLFHQLHDKRGSERFGQGGYSEHRLGRRRDLLFQVGKTKPFS
ncbi:MAG TPA: hypothetical protein VHE34_13810 [Puia sp.]|nr:hypothetical protein [Puia sp.]HVU96300.1 hypothetical protein [Puia sp.]